MSDEKPLHVQVAEALGWTSLEIVGRIMLPGAPWDYKGYPPGPPVIGHKEQVPHYDTDWSATGPLIKRFCLDVDCTPWKGGLDEWTATAWLPIRQEPTENRRVTGADPLLAVCNLIVALARDGKLPS